MRIFKHIVLLVALAFACVGQANATATLVYPKTNMNVSDTTFNFVWDAEVGAVSYDLQVSQTNTFSSFDMNLTGLTVDSVAASGLSFGHLYYWRVRTITASGPTAWSATGVFAYYNPTNFPNLAFWIKADGNVVKDAGNNVSQWITSGADFDTVAQTDPNKRPLYVANVLNGKPIIRFNGTSHALTGPNTMVNIGSNSFTTFVLGKATAASAAYYAKSKFAAATPRYGLYYDASSKLTGVYDEASTFNQAIARTFGSYEVVSQVADRGIDTLALLANNNVLKNSTNISGPSYNFSSTFRFIVGAYNDATDIGETQRLKGDIAEEIFYYQSFPDTTYRKISRYLMDKYFPPANLGPNIITNNFCADTLKVASGYSFYVWSTGQSGASVPSIVVNSPGTYAVTMTDPFQRVTVDTILVIRPPINYTGANSKICLGSTIRWATGLDSTVYTFHWSDNSTHSYLDISTPGAVTVTVTGPNNCSAVATPVSFTIDSFRVKVDLGPDTTLCTNNILGLKTGASLVANYSWSTGDTTTTTIINNQGLYHVSMTDFFGCTATDSTTVTVLGVGPIPSFSADTVCLHQGTSFTDLSTIVSPYTITSWNWSFGDTATSNQQYPQHTYAAAGTYTASFYVGVSNGCRSSLYSHQVLVRPTITALFTDSLACTGDSTRFFDRSTAPVGDTIIAWYWDFGSNSHALTKNAKHLFSTTGVAPVSLAVTSQYGCTDTFMRQVTINDTSGAPSGFVLSSPINNTNLIDAVDTFKWQASANAVRYVVQISNSSSFSNIIYSHEVYSPIDLVSSLPASLGTFYWRVTAYNLCGQSSTSNINSFTLFNPSLLGNMSFWVMADGQLVKNAAGYVTEWDDISGNGLKVVQANQTYAPKWVNNNATLNNKPVLRFDGNDSLNGGDILDMRTKSRTMFVIGKSLSQSGCYISKAAYGVGPDRWGVYRSAWLLAYKYVDNNIEQTVGATLTNYSNYEMVATKTDRQIGSIAINRNDSLLQQLSPINGTSYDMNSNRNLLVGAYGWGTVGPTNYFLNGDIAEIIFYDSVLTTADYNRVKRYLYLKYGGGPVYLGPDINIPYGFCDVVTLNASDRYVKYRWSTGDTTKTIAVRTSGTYAVTVTDVFDQIYSDTVVINKPAVPHPTSTTICLGDSVVWNADIGPGYTYRFSNNSTSPSITIHQGGRYWVKITDTVPPSQGGPCFITDTLTFVVDSFRVKASLGPDTTLCRGQYIGLRSQASNTVSYLWSTGSTDSTLLIDTAGLYSLIAISTNNCSAYDSIIVNTSGQVANVAFNVNQTSCIGDTVMLDNQTTINSPYQILSYNWAFGDTTSDTSASPSHYYQNPGTYHITLTVGADSNCYKSLSKVLIVNPLPVPSYTYTVGCANSPVIFRDNSTASLADPITSWQWDFGDGTTDNIRNPQHSFAAPGIYPVTLTVYTLTGCPKSLTDSIEIYPELTVKISAENFCKGDAVQFHDASPNFSDVQWFWQFPDNTFSTDSNPTKAFNPVGKYAVSLTVTNAVGCVNSTTDTIEIFNPPTANFDNPDNCVQFPYQFSDLSTAIVGDSLIGRVWDFGDSSATSIKHRPVHQYADTGTYQVTLTITSAAGCQAAVTKPVHLIGRPTAAFTYSPNYGGAPLDVTFNNLSTGGVRYAWDFGDGGTDTVENPRHTYTSNDTFPVRLIVYNQVGCSDTTRGEVIVQSSSLDLLVDQLSYTYDTVTNKYTITAYIFNVGTRIVNYFDVYTTFGNAPTVVEHITDTLPSGGQRFYTLNTQYISAVDDNQTYICMETRYPDGETDENPANNIKCITLHNDIRIIPPFPNPSDNQVTLGVVLPSKQLINITVFDEMGQLLGTVYNGEAPKGLSQWSVNTGTMMHGQYYFRIKYREDVHVVKFMVTHAH